jgi:transposase
MFIRQVKKKNAKKGKVFYQYQLVQASRIDGKVKQNQILYLGSDDELDNKDTRQEVLEQLQTKIFGQPSLLINDYSEISIKLAEQYYQKYLIKYDTLPVDNKIVIPTINKDVDFQPVDIKNLAVNNNKTFGPENLCKQIAEKLDFNQCFKNMGFNDDENKLANISIISRAVFTASEHKTAQYLEDNSSLKSLFNLSDTKITHQNLYKISDKLYQNKTVIDKYLYNKILDIFNIDDSIVIYDLSNTHFEGRKDNSKIARYGRNKQKRNDCKQVVFTGIINSAGFIRHSRTYEGNKADIATLEDMITDLEKHNSHTKDKIIVMDAGFASEDNLKFLDKNGYKYVCVSRQRLKDEIIETIKSKHSVEDRLGNKIELAVFDHEKHSDTWMYVKSEQKRVKEESITIKLCQRFEEELQGIENALHKKGGTKKTEKVWERIGRCKEKNRNVSGRYNIEVEQESSKATKVTWAKKSAKEKSDSKHGVYFIRTNIDKPTEQMLWDTYNTVREVEASFRCLKSDLQIRPVHHQKDDRIESHIYLTTLAYQLVNSIRYMLKDENINHSWTNIVRIMNTQSLLDVTLPMETKTLNITTSSKPIGKALEIYKATGTHSMIKRKSKYVVYH